MTALYDIIRGFRTAEGEVFRVAGTESEPFAAVDPRRMRVEVAAGASLRLAVLHTSPEVSALEIVLEKGARFVLTELFVSEAFAEVTVKQAARSLCHITAVQLSSANASYTVDLDGPGAESLLGGAFLAAGQEHCVVRLRTNHNVPDCRSNSYIKGVAGGTAVGEFCGLVYVAPDAQRTDARQQIEGDTLGVDRQLDLPLTEQRGGLVSQRFEAPCEADALDVYRVLRLGNPSPYLYLLRLDACSIVGSSPEALVTVTDGVATTRPIAGSRPRGATPEADATLEKDLLADEKERAEHTQLLDLGRNDCGRVAETGSVRVTERFTVERYSHVMHIVSNVEGKLKDGLDALAVLRATFPAGTVSGAPKLRAMEIIDELEPTKRGIYAGSAGYIGFHGDMDLAIAIRTAVIKDGELHVQAGAGIVADSQPALEWEETLNKRRAMFRAVALAEHTPRD